MPDELQHLDATPPKIAAGSIARIGIRRVGNTHAVQTNSDGVHDQPADHAELGQRAVPTDEREHRRREREEHESAEQPAEAERPAAEPPPGMRQVWFHAAVSDAASPVPVHSRPTMPMMLDATFVRCAVFTASVIVWAALPLSPRAFTMSLATVSGLPPMNPTTAIISTRTGKSGESRGC